jgi:hypothetical protein
VRKQRGFTLNEIAIMLVIIGLLLGGVLKGQELLTGARVRGMISQQGAIRAAYYGFNDRFRALPGDYNQATVNITGISTATCTGNGNGDGRIEIAGSGTPGEHILVWEHLSKAGFINGSYTCAAAGAETPASTPTNPFAARLQLVWDDVYDGTVANPVTARHNLKTGGQIASDILAEVDRKIDDGSATGGTFRFSAYNGGAGAPVGSGTCYLAAAPNQWQSATVAANCGGATLF